MSAVCAAQGGTSGAVGADGSYTGTADNACTSSVGNAGSTSNASAGSAGSANNADAGGALGAFAACRVCKHCVKVSRGVHPDVKAVTAEPGKREIAVDQIRLLKRDIIVLPNEAERKVYIINDADLMNKSAQNALLQMLEEPPSHAIFILETDNPAALYPTVRSRCMAVRLRPDASANTKSGRPAMAEKLAAELFTALENGNSSLISFMFRLEKLEKDAFAVFLSSARAQAAARLRECARSASGSLTGLQPELQPELRPGLQPELLANAERVLFKAGEMLDLNVSAGHLSGMICASLIKAES